MAGAEVVDHARLCFRFFSLLGDSGTVGGTCSGTARSDGDCEREREMSRNVVSFSTYFKLSSWPSPVTRIQAVY